VCCCAFELLQECRFSVPRIAGDDNERELACEHRRQEVPIKRGLHIGLLADDVETTSSRVASLALTVDRQEVANVWVRVRRQGRSAVVVVPGALIASAIARYT